MLWVYSVFFSHLSQSCNFKRISPLFKFLYTNFYINIYYFVYGSSTVLNWHLFLNRQAPKLRTKAVSSFKGATFPCFTLMPAAVAKSLQSCPTLCNPIDSSPPGSPVPGILQKRTLEWVAIYFPNAWKWKVKVKSLGCVWPSVTPWTADHQVPPSMGFSKQEYWSGVPLPSPLSLPYVKSDS